MTLIHNLMAVPIFKKKIPQSFLSLWAMTSCFINLITSKIKWVRENQIIAEWSTSWEGWETFSLHVFIHDVTLSNFHCDKCSTMRSHIRIFGVKHIFYALMIDNSFCVVRETKIKTLSACLWRRNGRKFTFCQLFEIALVWLDFHINAVVISTKTSFTFSVLSSTTQILKKKIKK